MLLFLIYILFFHVSEIIAGNHIETIETHNKANVPMILLSDSFHEVIKLYYYGSWKLPNKKIREVHGKITFFLTISRRSQLY